MLIYTQLYYDGMSSPWLLRLYSIHHGILLKIVIYIRGIEGNIFWRLKIIPSPCYYSLNKITRMPCQLHKINVTKTAQSIPIYRIINIAIIKQIFLCCKVATVLCKFSSSLNIQFSVIYIKFDSVFETTLGIFFFSICYS